MSFDDEIEAAIGRQQEAQTKLAAVIAQKRELIESAKVLITTVAKVAGGAVIGYVPGPAAPVVSEAIDLVIAQAVKELSKHE